MAQAPSLKRLSLEDFKPSAELKPVLEQLFQTLNPFLGDVTGALTGQLTLENMAVDVRTLTINAPDDWLAPSFAAGASDTGGSWETAAYRKGEDGRVEIRGVVTLAAVPGDVLTLPAGYRPTSDARFACNGNGAFADVTVTSAGVVNCASGASPVSLRGVSFLASERTPSLLGSPFPLTYTLGTAFRTPARGVLVLRLSEADSSSTVCPLLGTPDWEPTVNQGQQAVKIRRIPHLWPGKAYKVTLLTLA